MPANSKLRLVVQHRVDRRRRAPADTVRLTPSQLELLRFLNGEGGGTSVRRSRYEALLNLGLIERSGGHYTTTELGRDVLGLLRRS